MTSLALPALPVIAPATGWRRTWLLLSVEYRRVMESRVAWLAWALVLYTVALIPFILDSPQQAIAQILASWIGHDASGGNIVLFIWTDVAMNKLAIILGAVLGSGIIADERANGSFDVLLSKPMPASDYFVARLGAAVAAMATFYIGADVLAVATFPWRVAAFPLGDFLALGSVHVFATLFSVVFAAMVAAITGRRMIAMLTTVMVIGMCVDLAFLGFYYPAIIWLALLNPFFHGVRLIGMVGQYGPLDMLQSILILMCFNLVAAAIGRACAVALVNRG